jgi:hypothetical protein
MSVTVCRLPQTRSASQFDCAAGRKPIRAGELRLDVWENEGGALAREPKQGHEQGVLTIPGSGEQLGGCPPSKGRGVIFFHGVS